MACLWRRNATFASDDAKILRSVAAQLMNGNEVLLGEMKLPVKRVGHGRLRIVRFHIGGREFEAIEQNPEKPSRWGQLAREGHQVVQFKDVVANRYVAVTVDGEVKEYGR